MRQSSDSNNKNLWFSAFNAKALTVGGEVGCLTLVIVLLSVFGGLWLDRTLDTKPLFTILFVLLSAPVSLVLTYLIAMRSVKDMNIGKPKDDEMSDLDQQSQGEDNE